MQIKIKQKYSRLTTGILLLLFSWTLPGSANAQSLVLQNDKWQINGTVYATAKDPSTGITYVGGEFGTLTKTVSLFGSVDANTGVFGSNDIHPVIKGVGIYAVIPDGNGGFYIGGQFSEVNGIPRNNTARINANGQVIAWNPDVDGPVECLLKVGNTVYIGGAFGNVANQARQNIAAVNANSGTIDSWNPGADNAVHTLATDGTRVFVGGGFKFFGGGGLTTHNRLASFNISTGIVDVWTPDISRDVWALVIDGSTMYLGGQFTTVDGQIRHRLAAYNISTGVLAAWNPDAAATVYCLAKSGNSIFAGGQFFSIGGQTRQKIASIDATTGAVNSWNLTTDATSIRALYASGNSVYLGGDFSNVGGQLRFGAAAVDVSTAAVSAWLPDAYSGNVPVRTFYESNGKVFLGGDFQGLNLNYQHDGLVAFDADGELLPWTMNLDYSGAVRSLYIYNNTLYAGGSFTSFGGQIRNRLASIDLATQSLNSWDPNASGQVNSIIADGSTIYAGGSFANIGGQSRNNLAALNAATGLAATWNPNVNGAVNTLQFAGGVIYAGGSFTTAGGQNRNRLAAFDGFTGAAMSWDPNANNSVLSIDIDGNTLYAGGDFTSIGGQSRSRLTAIDLATGTPTSWNPGVDGTVQCVKKVGNAIYLGGGFGQIGNQPHLFLGAVDATNGAVQSWDPTPNSNVLTLGSYPPELFVGGHFDRVGGLEGLSQAGFVRYAPACTKAPKTPGAISQTGGAAKICPGETRTFTITPPADTTGAAYYWKMPAGASIVSGQGTNEVVVSFDGSYASSDTIKVRAENGCGSSAYRIKVVNKSTAPNTPAAITGENYGLCNQTGVAYSTTNVADINYTWTFSNANGAVASGQGTNAITADFTPSAATTVLSVTATNGCGTSSPRNKTIYAKPGKPVSISGASAVCAHASGVAYSTPAVYGAASYTWKAPAGSHVSDGVTTSTGASLTTTSNSVTVNFGASAGDVQVRANNTCGSSAFFFHPITMNCRIMNGIEEAIASEDITVYPNPASDQVTVSFNADKAGEYTIHLYDVLGKEILTTTGNATKGINQAEVNTSLLTSGVYQLVLKGAELGYNTKLILDK